MRVGGSGPKGRAGASRMRRASVSRRRGAAPALLLLLCACAGLAGVSAEEGDAELLAMKTSQLLQKGRERGVSHGALERCMDDDDTKQCVVTAIHAREADVAAKAEAKRKKAEAKAARKAEKEAKKRAKNKAKASATSGGTTACIACRRLVAQLHDRLVRRLFFLDQDIEKETALLAEREDGTEPLARQRLLEKRQDRSVAIEQEMGRACDADAFLFNIALRDRCFELLNEHEGSIERIMSGYRDYEGHTGLAQAICGEELSDSCPSWPKGAEMWTDEVSGRKNKNRLRSMAYPSLADQATKPGAPRPSTRPGFSRSRPFECAAEGGAGVCLAQ